MNITYEIERIKRCLLTSRQRLMLPYTYINRPISLKMFMEIFGLLSTHNILERVHFFKRVESMNYEYIAH